MKFNIQYMFYLIFIISITNVYSLKMKSHSLKTLSYMTIKNSINEDLNFVDINGLIKNNYDDFYNMTGQVKYDSEQKENIILNKEDLTPDDIENLLNKTNSEVYNELYQSNIGKNEGKL